MVKKEEILAKIEERKKELEELKERIRKVEEEIKTIEKEKEENVKTLQEVQTKIEIEKLPEKPSKFLRNLIRFLVLIFFIFVFSFGIWFFISKRIPKKVSPPQIPSTTQTSETSTEVQTTPTPPSPPEPSQIETPSQDPLISILFDSEVEIKIDKKRRNSAKNRGSIKIK